MKNTKNGNCLRQKIRVTRCTSVLCCFKLNICGLYIKYFKQNRNENVREGGNPIKEIKYKRD